MRLPTLLHRLAWATATAAFLAAACTGTLGLLHVASDGGAGLSPLLAGPLGLLAGAICALACREADRIAREHPVE